MKVAVVMASVSRNAGGLFPAARRLTEELVAQPATELKVIGLRDEHTAEDAKLWAPTKLLLCEPRGPKILAYSPDYRSFLSDEPFDLVHQHGIWTMVGREVTRFSASSRTRYLVSMHGMVEPWALKNGRWKKRIAWLAYQKENLERATALLVNSEREAQCLRDLGIRTPVVVVPNGTDKVVRGDGQPAFRPSIPTERKVVLFLGRLHPKKGLHELVRGFAEARRRDAAVAQTWSLVIAGWDDGGHEQALRDLCQELGLMEPQLCITGPVFGATKNATLCEASAFVLPSFGEGMPVAALEAMSAGLPVLLSAECNLSEAFRSGAGICIEPSASGVASGVLELSRLSGSERTTMGQKGQALVAERYTWPRIGAQVRHVYEWCLGGGPPPPGLWG
jgi:glycosyltransferase involved in cell wall biosynthesis